MKMLCPECGRQLPDGSTACNGCGKEFIESTIEAPVFPSVPPEMPDSGAVKIKKKGGLKVIIGLAVTAVMIGTAAIGVKAYFHEVNKEASPLSASAEMLLATNNQSTVQSTEANSTDSAEVQLLSSTKAGLSKGSTTTQNKNATAGLSKGQSNKTSSTTSNKKQQSNKTNSTASNNKQQSTTTQNKNTTASSSKKQTNNTASTASNNKQQSTTNQNKNTTASSSKKEKEIIPVTFVNSSKESTKYSEDNVHVNFFDGYYEVSTNLDEGKTLKIEANIEAKYCWEGMLALSPSGKYIYYYTDVDSDYIDSDSYTLCRIEYDKLKENPDKINQNVEIIADNCCRLYLQNTLMKDDTIIYYTDSSKFLWNKDVYYYNGKRSRCIAKDVKEYFIVGVDKIIYRTSKGWYGVSVDNIDKKIELVPSDGTLYYCINDEIFVYTREEENGTNLYSVDFSKETKLLAKSVSYIERSFYTYDNDGTPIKWSISKLMQELNEI